MENVGSCTNFTPGVVLSLEQHYMPPSDCIPGKTKQSAKSPISGLVEPAFSYYSPSARLALRVYYVAPGEEVKYTKEIAKFPHVLITNLNYIGTLANVDIVKADNESGFFNPHLDAVWFLKGEEPQPLSKDGIIKNLSIQKSIQNQAVVTIIDPRVDHCIQVIETASEAYIAEKGLFQNSDPLFLAFCMKQFNGNAVDLWTFSSLVLALCELNARISAINFSVDLGALCGKRENLPSPLASWIYSFPLFEKILDEVILSFRRRGDDPPLIFAAAGNRRTRDKLWRLAYPAVLPNIIAVTQTLQTHTAENSINEIDTPAVGPLKPCFTEPFNPNSKNLGTSFASAALAGRWAYWDVHHSLQEKNLGQFQKLAYLLHWSKGCELINPTHNSRNLAKPWVPTIVRQLIRSRADQAGKTSESLLAKLITNLNGSFRTNEFLITGSGAFADSWLTHNCYQALEHSKRVFEFIGDLDILYAGPKLSTNNYKEALKIILDYLSHNGQNPDQWHSRIQIHTLSNWAGGIHLLQCVIPSACIFLTADGEINPWSTKNSEASNSTLEFFPPTNQAWEWNPQFQSGSSGLAHGLFIWININLIRAKLQKAFSTTQPQWHLPVGLSNHKIIGPAVKAILLENNGNYDPESLSQMHLRYLFGSRLPNSYIDRFSSRLKRTLKLTNGEEGGFWHNARQLHSYFTKVWEQKQVNG